MEAGMIILLLFALQGAVSSANFYGDSFSLMPPEKQEDGTFQMTFYHRLNAKGVCEEQASFECDGASCSFQKSKAVEPKGEDIQQDSWCQSETHTMANISTTQKSFSLRASGCCWPANLEAKTTWKSLAELDLGTRSDTQGLNSCPVSTTVSSLRVPQNCFTSFRLLAHDPDGDTVRCGFTKEAVVPAGFTLDETTCTLKSSGQVGVGVHVFELMLEDFPSKNITLTYADGSTVFQDVNNKDRSPLCKVKLQFAMEILAPIPNCELGHVQPMFLSETPSHDDVLYASVGQEFRLVARAQANHARITSFQVSGPQDMKTAFSQEDLGKALLTQTWTPQSSDLYRFIPVCFTAETKEAQSEMRCIVVMVTQASIIQGKAAVQCSPNKMNVVLEKASMPGIDENFLQLRDSSCSLTSNSTHIMGSMSFSTCGTKVEDKGDFIVFTNEINSFELPNEVIVRREKVKIDFSCKFPKTISISSYYSLHKSDYIFTESSFGSFGYTFEIYRDKDFKNRVPARAYPVEVKLLETIFMGIKAQSELPDVKLFVESCKATPDDNPDNSRFYNLINNGCVEDETFKVHPSDQTSFNFEVQAFKFNGNFDQVYITCSVILCEPSSPFSRCAQGCLKEPARRRRRGVSKETGGHYITQGPLLFIRQAVPEAEAFEEDSMMMDGDAGLMMKIKTPEVMKNDTLDVMKNSSPAEVIPPPLPKETGWSEGEWKIKEMISTNISTVFFATAFLVALVAMAAVLYHFRKKRKAEDRKSLIVSGWN
ncbi:uncharacterized protein LOC117809478 [Notolabrus celidotus]|uniref:uncharacterized protein LOC117809478 n=1 Tax=Notolabrus celidotus TaxID=1203425 RepID=UPI00148FDD8A|nr:uncharacterized protein LOC117809478 [Notolabrus celidotus]